MWEESNISFYSTEHRRQANVLFRNSLLLLWLALSTMVSYICFICQWLDIACLLCSSFILAYYRCIRIITVMFLIVIWQILPAFLFIASTSKIERLTHHSAQHREEITFQQHWFFFLFLCTCWLFFDVQCSCVHFLPCCWYFLFGTLC